MADGVTFLLGAGASMDAGLPSMKDLVDSFVDAEKGADPPSTALAQVLRGLESFVSKSTMRKVLDLELLLEALEALATRDENVLTPFVDGWQSGGPGSEDPSRFADLKRRLEDHLRRSLDVDPALVTYLGPFVRLARELKGLDVFTLNYDVAMEVAAEVEDVSYTDGFDTTWNPALFDEIKRHPIRLYKLHGSLIWYAREAGRIVKIEARPADIPTDVSHITGGRLQAAMIYPGPGKELHSRPYADLLQRFRDALDASNRLVVIGCSLRDAHVRQAIVEKLAADRQMKVVLVDPDPEAVLDGSDAAFPTSLQFSGFRRQLVARTATAAEAIEARQISPWLAGCQVVLDREEALVTSRQAGDVDAQANAARRLFAAAPHVGTRQTWIVLLPSECAVSARLIWTNPQSEKLASRPAIHPGVRESRPRSCSGMSGSWLASPRSVGTLSYRAASTAHTSSPTSPTSRRTGRSPGKRGFEHSNSSGRIWVSSLAEPKPQPL